MLRPAGLFIPIKVVIPYLLGADQPERRILRQPLRIVQILVSRQATVDGLSQQIRERQLSVLAAPVVHDVFGDERTQSQTFVQFAHQQQTTVGSDPRTLEIDSQRRIKRELKGLILFLTHWVEASTMLIVLSKPHECWRWRDHTTTYSEFKKEMR